MVFWGDSTGLPRPYRGWDVFVAGEQNGTTTKLAASLKKLLAWLQEYMSVDTVTLLLPIADRQKLAVYATLGLEEEIVQQILIPIGQGVAGRIAASRSPMIVNNLAQVEVISPILRQKGLRSLVGIPVCLNQEVVGVLHVGTLEPHQFTDRDVEQLQLVAHRLKIEIKDAGLLKFDQVCDNQKGWLEILGFNKRTFVNTVKFA
ncbi:GAF domain-containing protein [Tolypothrix campylonemoides VB511288]|nr:GAF domain-containing protein [Tolypothrix campylonemoides VB511288]